MQKAKKIIILSDLKMNHRERNQLVIIKNDYEQRKKALLL